MKQRVCAPLLMAGLLVLSGSVSAETPTAASIVERAISAVESESTLAEHDMLRLAIRQEETLSDGTTTNSDLTALVHGGQLENIRLELTGGITLVLHDNEGWAMMRGQIDIRPQTPRMAAGTIRQTLFPLLLPFSLRMEGVEAGIVTEGSFDGTPAWVIDLRFDANFFAAPSMLTPWRVFISREDNMVLGAEFLPPDEFRAVTDEGVRYRFLKRKKVDGLNLPSQILLDGIDLNGAENGHVRVTKMTGRSVGPLELSLFVNPEPNAKFDPRSAQ